MWIALNLLKYAIIVINYKEIFESTAQFKVWKSSDIIFILAPNILLRLHKGHFTFIVLFAPFYSDQTNTIITLFHNIYDFCCVYFSNPAIFVFMIMVWAWTSLVKLAFNRS